MCSHGNYTTTWRMDNCGGITYNLFVATENCPSECIARFVLCSTEFYHSTTFNMNQRPKRNRDGIVTNTITNMFHFLNFLDFSFFSKQTKLFYLYSSEEITVEKLKMILLQVLLDRNENKLFILFF